MELWSPPLPRLLRIFSSLTASLYFQCLDTTVSFLVYPAGLQCSHAYWLFTTLPHFSSFSPAAFICEDSMCRWDAVKAEQGSRVTNHVGLHPSPSTLPRSDQVCVDASSFLCLGSFICSMLITKATPSCFPIGMEARGQPEKLVLWVPVIPLGQSALQQMPLPTEPSVWPPHMFLSCNPHFPTLSHMK